MGAGVSNSEVDLTVVAKFVTGEDPLDPGIVPVASLCVLWYVEEDGEDGVVSKFDGEQRVSVTVGDLTALIHEYLHHDADAQ